MNQFEMLLSLIIIKTSLSMMRIILWEKGRQISPKIEMIPHLVSYDYIVSMTEVKMLNAELENTCRILPLKLKHS